MLTATHWRRSFPFRPDPYNIYQSCYASNNLAAFIQHTKSDRYKRVLAERKGWEFITMNPSSTDPLGGFPCWGSAGNRVRLCFVFRKSMKEKHKGLSAPLRRAIANTRGIGVAELEAGRVERLLQRSLHAPIHERKR